VYLYIKLYFYNVTLVCMATKSNFDEMMIMSSLYYITVLSLILLVLAH